MEHNLSRKSHPGLSLTGASPLPIQSKPSKTNLPKPTFSSSTADMPGLE